MAVQPNHLLTIVLALLGSLFFAGGTLLVKRGLQHADSVTGAAIQILVSAVVFALAAPWAIHAADWFSPAVWIFAAIGLLRPSVSTILANEGMRRLGPTIATTMESLSPFFAVLGGVLFLAEPLTLPTAVGTLGVMAGAATISARGRLPRSWPLWALLFPVAASLIRSAAHVVAKMGLLLLPNVIMSGLVAYVVSGVVALTLRRMQPEARRGALMGRGTKWFMLAGVVNAAAIFSLNTALMLGQVVLVSPVVAAYPVFTMLGSWLFYRSEPITGRMVLALLLVVPSVVLIALGN